MNMKKLNIFLLVIILSTLTTIAQTNTFIGASPIYEQPVGELSKRFKAGYGAILFAGYKTSDNMSWLGSFSFSSFTKPNYDKLIKQVEVQSGLDKIFYQFSLNRLSMKLNTSTLMAEANYTFLKTNSFSTNLNFGFGFTNWTFTRENFSDSLSAVLPNSSAPKVISKLNVPENTQSDWSGTIKVGINANYEIARPIELFVLINYRIIVGELWPSLALDIENVSGIQIIQLGLGIKASF